MPAIAEPLFTDIISIYPCKVCSSFRMQPAIIISHSLSAIYLIIVKIVNRERREHADEKKARPPKAAEPVIAS
ncbi:hypothetical protein CHH67_05515 [Paenibacillus campinasensis]|uniref:Uncharacterized protein n=1 Tax=Paenibacillus campinasensis TaxID=66347 RepID=A0A268F0K2_9BACL|nr:hypothetical protein CHH67_05515 [Paenibacillus campinasensis]